MGPLKPSWGSFDKAGEPEGNLERQGGLSREDETKVITGVTDSRNSSGPHKELPIDQPGCESGTLGDSPNVWPDFTSQKKTPSEENSCVLAFDDLEPPCMPLGRASVTCGNTIQSAWTWETHWKSHPRKVPYTCSQCGKAFCCSTHLVQHQGMHTGAKPHACKDCSKAFSQVTHLTQHQRVHTREKPYKCGDSGRAFRDCSSLIWHLRTHSRENPYHCHVCSKDFAQSSSLMEHQRVHSSEKLYKCGNCGKAFSCSSALTMHLRVHIVVLQ